MYAIAEISGSQVRLENGKKVRVPKLNNEIGSKIELSRFLLTVNDQGEVKVGTPFVDGNATLSVLEHKRDKKIHLFKKKRRKGYVKQGSHRQHYTVVYVETLSV
ncbi:MAG: 50S ribosomal protein L21 [bacterium]|nr:50S ribosomal protein L21 [bacterium]